ncbi:unnamed protein product, partial [Gulo gulo]
RDLTAVERRGGEWEEGKGPPRGWGVTPGLTFSSPRPHTQGEELKPGLWGEAPGSPSTATPPFCSRIKSLESEGGLDTNINPRSRKQHT